MGTLARRIADRVLMAVIDRCCILLNVVQSDYHYYKEV